MPVILFARHLASESELNEFEATCPLEGNEVCQRAGKENEGIAEVAFDSEGTEEYAWKQKLHGMAHHRSIFSTVESSPRS